MTAQMLSPSIISYIVYALALVLMLLVFGIPRITSRVKLPREFQWRELADQELSQDARMIFLAAEPKASGLFFILNKTFTMLNVPYKNEIRLYFNSQDATGLLVSVFHTSQRTMSVCEFTTRFEDGTELDTSNSNLSGVFTKPDWMKVERHPGMDIPKLYEAHQKRVEEMKSRGIAPRQQALDKLMDEIKQSQDRQIEFQASNGILKPGKDAGAYQLTSKVAFRGVGNYLNPFAHDFTMRRMLVGGAVGVGLAFAAILLANYFNAEARLKELLPMLSPGKIAFLCYVPGFLLAGIAAGWQFPQKGFLWGFLISIPAVFLLPAGTTPLMFSLVSAFSGYVADTLHEPVESGRGFQKLIAALVFLAGLIVVYFLRVK